MCNIGALVSVWKASTAVLAVSWDNVKTQATSNASNDVAVNFLEALLVGFNYWNTILKHVFREITLIIIQTNKQTDAAF